jgi:hypothetical protein
MYERSSRPRVVAVFMLLVLGVAPALAQTAPPSPAEVLGYALGEHFTPYWGVQQYSKALAAASDRVEYRAYGMTPERRELFQLVIATPENLRRLDQILALNAELTRPQTTPQRAREIIARNPAVVYFSYGVHGNESSSSEAGMWTAWDLAREASEVAGVLEQLIVIIDPVANPDGRDRYVQWFNSVVGARANPNPQAREHREPWPGGRFNHYLFDLNRDWAWGTQPETRARLATWWVYNPQVHVDFHEMGYNSSYFFFPAAAPINPIYPEHILEWGRRFGAANAAAFDERGWKYYTGEAFDLFYPGYGDSWPSLTGAIGMTYEQAGHGMAGRAIERAAGDTLTLHQRAQQHRTAGHATLRASADGRVDLLSGFANAQRTAGAGLPDVLLVPGADASRVAALVEHLRQQGIEVERANRSFRAGATAHRGFDRRGEFPAGTYRVRMQQPRGRLAATLLQPETQLRAEYSYDITAWSLPYAYDVEAHSVRSTPAADWQAAGAAVAAAAAPAAPAAYGYLVTPSEPAAAGVVRLLEEGGRARVLARPTTIEGRRWPAGTWFIPVQGNADVRERVEQAGLGALAVGVSTGRSQEGIDLGSDRVVPVHLPRVGVVTGDGVSPTSFGAHWFFLEQHLGLQFDALLAGDVGRIDLRPYDVLVIPDGSPAVLGEQALDRLRSWVEMGGRVVAVGRAAEAIARMADIRMRDVESDGPERAALLAGRREREREDWLQQVHGVILQARIDPAHPLTWGAATAERPERLFLLHEGTNIFEPAGDIEPVIFFGADPPRISGVISDANRRHLGEGVWAASKRMGRGNVIVFAGDPLFRMFWRTTHPLYVNALLLGPGM